MRAQLDPKRIQALDSTLERQARESLEWIRELDGQLTRTNFLTNGGATIATLAFIGTGTASNEAVWPLTLFTIGAVVTGIELRFLLSYYAALHKDVIQRRRGFLNGDFRVKDLRVPSNIAKWPRQFNRWPGLVSQLCFVVGVVLTACLLWPDT